MRWKALAEIYTKHSFAQFYFRTVQRSINSFYMYTSIQSIHPYFLKILISLAVRAVVDVLCELGVAVNATTARGETPLCIAGHNGHAATVRVLCERGADVNAAITVDDGAHHQRGLLSAL